MLQRFVSILLLLVIVYHQIAYFIQFKVEQYQIKKEVKKKIMQNIPKNELTLLSFSICGDEYRNLDWLDGGKEIRYKGRLYDIVKKQEKNGIIKIQCFDDTKEDALFAKLNINIEDYIKTREQSKQSNKGFKNPVKEYVVSLAFTLNDRIYYTNIIWPYSNHYTFNPEFQLFSPPKLASTSYC